ncbi:hypothetical protein SAMN05216464_11085 [Mucilaginibacter pineti]|uniref:Lipoprotein n=1 Tax=Mucilaginibacter pineti TaxID=1391627 RepID=A0A1G7GD17_9SPHI|nr:hypothetical protein [Mucilaginibacter pineti]SDE85981.1 hypothetical protein SAMN05216464_11085 [Mucilaginibacter pineti]
MKKHLPLLFLFALAIGCKKKEQYRESTWTANGETFTAVAKPSLGKAIAILASDEIHNRFSITFYLSYPSQMPQEGAWQIGNSSLGEQNPNCAYVYCYYKNSAYFFNTVNRNKVLIASSFNGKAHYSLPSTWFANYNHTDSIQVSGDFYEP